jgi:hypothetical protein
VTRRVLVATASLIAAGAVTASSFSVFASRWPNGNVTLQLQLGTSAALSNGARSWGEVAEAALADWNRTIQTLQLQAVRDSTSAKGDGNSINNVFFSSDIYGMDFEANVLAVTTTWRRGSARTEADVIFNAGRSWDAYDGTLKRSPTDFRRVALHEFGHVLGLDHPDENGQAVSSIMNSHVSDLDRLTPDDIAGAQSLYGSGATTGSGLGGGSVSFPPRNESLDFRNQLETVYRDGLRRSGFSTSVDNEGAVVWTQEYLRYRVNLCAHFQAVDRVMTQIDGGGIQGVCGTAPPGQVNFPPRNESLDFRNALEARYRDGLRRLPISTSVDVEGEVVWTQEYLRYRVNGCGHATAVQSVLTQIEGRPAPPVCR